MTDHKHYNEKHYNVVLVETETSKIIRTVKANLTYSGAVSLVNECSIDHPIGPHSFDIWDQNTQEFASWNPPTLET